MNKPAILLTTLVFFSFGSVCTGATKYVDDGLLHEFKQVSSDRYWIDSLAANDPGTHIEIVDGASILSLSLYNNASANMTGGLVRSGFFVNGNGTANISGGTITHDIWALDHSTVTVTDGMLGGISSQTYGRATMSGGTANRIGAQSSGIITISGGTVVDSLRTWGDGIIYLLGTNFTVTDRYGKTTSLAYGNRLSEFVTLDANNEVFIGSVAGILADGSPLNCEFTVWNTGEYPNGTGDIIIIPEPYSLALLGLGGLLLRKRR